VLEVVIFHRACGDCCQLNMATPLEHWSKREFRAVIRFLKISDIFEAKYIVRISKLNG
jgi:hypothetical protein